VSAVSPYRSFTRRRQDRRSRGAPR
jgi:hypothetical protein